jgi:hypothetical protein
MAALAVVPFAWSGAASGPARNYLPCLVQALIGANVRMEEVTGNSEMEARDHHMLEESPD